MFTTPSQSNRAFVIKNAIPLLRNTSAVYLDSAATTPMPDQVITAYSAYARTHYAPIHRSFYAAGEDATRAYEKVRDQVAHYINARASNEIIFTAHATDSINMVAYSWALHTLTENDAIITSPLEHHANLLVWQFIARITKAQLIFMPLNPDYTLDMPACAHIIQSLPVKLITVTHTSHVLGTWMNVKQLAHYAHARGARILVDAAQSAPHSTLDVQDLDVDFLAFSAHKMMGPPGLGILYCAQSTHHELLPYRYGGGMVHSASLSTATYAPLPHRLEAGTPHSTGVIAFGATLDYHREHIDRVWLTIHETHLCRLLHEGLSSYPEITLLTNIKNSPCHIVTFVVANVHAHDIAAALDCQGVSVRAGNHCAQPLHELIGHQATVRLSVYAYTTETDISKFFDVFETVMAYFRRF